VLVVTGPSGVGKGTLIRGLLHRLPEVQLAVSATTREPRANEVNGRDYHFLTPDEFDARARAAEFVEHAEYAGNRYGTLRSELERPASAILLEIDLQGARQVRATLPEAVQVFVAPPSVADLEHRLRARGSDSAEQIQRRLEVAPTELAAQQEFSRVVVNDELQRALGEIVEIAASMYDPDERRPPLATEGADP
jgi:guanylate kinase